MGTLSSIKTSGNGLPNRYLLHGVEKVGKTSFGAQFPRPVFIQSRGETGLETLIDAGQLPEIPHFPECQTWGDVKAALQALISEDHAYRTVVIDTLNGVERLCHEYVCKTQFGGDWGREGFLSYNKGYEVSLGELRSFLQLLDDLRARRKMIVLILCHSRIKPFQNPDGANYDRWIPDCHEKTWGLAHKWCDVILFYNYFVAVDKKTGKGVGGDTRMLYAVQSATVIAGNRIGLPAEIVMGSSPEESYQILTNEIKNARNQKCQSTTQSDSTSAK